VALASRLAKLSGRLVGQHYGIGSAAIGAIHRRLADRPTRRTGDYRIADKATKKEEDKVQSVSLTPLPL